jgi:protein-tyrosine phosphatase
LGGYATADGHSTRWRTLYRSGALHDLTPDDEREVRALGVRTVIDLRTPSEIARTGRGPLSDGQISFVNASVTRDGSELEARSEPPPDHDPLADRYLGYLEEGGSAFVQALQLMAVPHSYPIVFSCFLGKDRSGVLAALVLGCLGVTTPAIVEDYAASESSMSPLVERLRHDPVYRDTIERTPPNLLSANPQTMRTFLADLERRHGGARNWARHAGLTDHDIDALRRCLLE